MHSEHLEQLAAGPGIEVGGRLVEHEQGWSHREHGRDRDASPLTHRELVRCAVDHMRHADARERLGDAGVDLVTRQPMLSGPKATSSRTVGMNS